VQRLAGGAGAAATAADQADLDRVVAGPRARCGRWPAARQRSSTTAAVEVFMNRGARRLSGCLGSLMGEFSVSKSRNRSVW